MKTGLEALKELGVIPDKDGNISGTALLEAGLPMVVKCCMCEMTMCVASETVRVDEHDHVYCKDCAKDWEDYAADLNIETLGKALHAAAWKAWLVEVRSQDPVATLGHALRHAALTVTKAQREV